MKKKKKKKKHLPCLLTCPEDFGNFHASVSLLPWRVSPWLPPHQEHRDVGKRHVCGGGSRVVSSQDSGLSPLLCHHQGHRLSPSFYIL